jgi:hypothetical protein
MESQSTSNGISSLDQLKVAAATNGIHNQMKESLTSGTSAPVKTKKKGTRITEIITAYSSTQTQLSEILGVPIFHPELNQKLSLVNWYAGNNQISVYNLSKILEQAKFEQGIDNIMCSFAE